MANNPPVVNAGIDQTITLPINQVTLSGSATDSDGVIIIYKWTKVSGPSGGTINTPSSAFTSVSGLIQGVYTMKLTATDNSRATGYDTCIITVNPIVTPAPVVTSGGAASGQVGQAFSYSITASNTPTSYNAVGLPAGLSINTSTGAITGTPTTSAGSPFSVIISATNAGGTGTKVLSITITPATPVVTSANTVSATVGIAFSYTITASNSPTSYNATGLPAGLSINTTTGVISGTPTTSGVTTITVSAINAGGTGNLPVVVTIINLPAPVITSANTATATINTAFVYNTIASNNPTSYGATGLPTGLSINTSTGVISGTPTVSGSFNVTISATNAGGTGTVPLALSVAGAAFLTANDFASVIPYTGAYAYGNNLGYYGSHLTDQNLALLAKNSGAMSIRPSLPDQVITPSPTFAVTRFQYYKNTIGLIDLTSFLGSVYGPNRDMTVYPGASVPSLVWIGLYNDTWLDAARTQINPANKFAKYVYDAVTTYGIYTKFWEIINEADYTGNTNDATLPQGPFYTQSWWNRNPQAGELINLQAPPFYYIRILRVAWEVIKKLQPNSYVATGGFGYPSFADVVCRNTDNPVDGSVTTQYPLKGGAYFDILNFHDYPQYNLCPYDNSVGRNVCARHSDALLNTHISYVTNFTGVLTAHGYDGTIYPKKGFICTETDVARQSAGADWGSLQAQINYIIKMHVSSQPLIYQVYKFGMGDTNAGSIFDKMGVYLDLTPSTTTVANAPKAQVWYATKTLQLLLFGNKYDAIKTAALSLPSGVRGAAFNDGAGNYTYCLWAKTATDNSEIASASYTFPFTFPTTRYEWDYSTTNASTVVSSSTVTLTGNPSFFK